MEQRHRLPAGLGLAVLAVGLASCGEAGHTYYTNGPTKVCGVPFGPRVVSPRPLTEVLDQDGNVQLPTVPPNGNVVIQLAACGKGGDLVSVEGATVADRYMDKSGVIAVWLKSLPTATHVRVVWAGNGRHLTLDMAAAH